MGADTQCGLQAASGRANDIMRELVQFEGTCALESIYGGTLQGILFVRL